MAGKGLLALIAGKPKVGGPEKSGPPAMGDSMGGEDEVASALGEMFEALQSGDNSGAALAFKRAYHACADEGAEESDPLAGIGEDEEEGDELDL